MLNILEDNKFLATAVYQPQNAMASKAISSWFLKIPNALTATEVLS